ncbi:MAG TPA: universal stress protein [bacterium]|nr:universal stress protein [bacterium]
MYRRILIPTDGSACSQLALEHALGLAKEQQAEVRIVHVLDLQPLYTSEALDVEPIVDAWRRSAEAVVTEAAAAAARSGVHAEHAVLEALGHRVADVIVDESKRWQADLIVIGTHGRRGLHHVLLGSVAEGVVRTTTVPVLLIRGR